jgi:hypothetical protein
MVSRMTDATSDGQDGLWEAPSAGEPDLELDEVAAAIRLRDPEGARFARAIRRSIDMLLDGQHTGRYRWEQLHKTEKTHAGTLIEINIQREFSFSDGDKMDYAIEGIDVDCKFSQTMGSWMIPPEAVDHLLLVVWANDEESRWSVGLVRANPEFLNIGKGNRDGKRTLSIYGKRQIRWIFRDAPLQENMLLKLAKAEVDQVFAAGAGQKRVNELFRMAQGRLVSRNVVATVAMQEDYMKRVRGNGGARSFLREEGIVILGDYENHAVIARALKITTPGAGEFLSVKLRLRDADRDSVPYVELGGEQWVVDPYVKTTVKRQAPLLPTVHRRSDG